MKLLSCLIGTFVYVIVWVFVGFSIGMSHSVPYYKYQNEIYRYYFLIMLGELVVYIFLLYLLNKLGSEARNVLGMTLCVGLCADFAWRIIQFTQYGDGYYFFEKLGMHEGAMVLTINLIPLVLIILATAYREKLGKLLFGRFIKVNPINS